MCRLGHFYRRYQRSKYSQSALERHQISFVMKCDSILDKAWICGRLPIFPTNSVCCHPYCVCECLLNWAVWYPPWTLDNKAFYCFQILENNINFLWDHFLDERHPLVEVLICYTKCCSLLFFRSKITHKQAVWHLTRFEWKDANLLIHTNRQKMNKKRSRRDLMASIHA